MFTGLLVSSGKISSIISVNIIFVLPVPFCFSGAQIIHMFNSNSLFFISLNFFLIIFFIWEIYLEFYVYVLALIFQAIFLSLLTPKFFKSIFLLRKKYFLGKHSLLIYLSYLLQFPLAFFCLSFLHYCEHADFLKFSSPCCRLFFKDIFLFETSEYCFFLVFVLYLNKI